MPGMDFTMANSGHLPGAEEWLKNPGSHCIPQSLASEWCGYHWLGNARARKTAICPRLMLISGQ